MMRAIRGRVVATLVLSGVLGSASLGVAASDSCRDPLVTVQHAEPADAKSVCAGAARAKSFFSSAGLPYEFSLQIDICTSFENPKASHAFGYYDPRLDKIFFLSYVSFSNLTEDSCPFQVPTSRELYSSFIAHEVAHGLLLKGSPGFRSLRWHEYVAYTTQIATMGDDTREKILTAYSLKGFTRAEEVSELYYFMNPCAFGVKAYLHYAGKEDGAAFLRHIVETNSKTRP